MKKFSEIKKGDTIYRIRLSRKGIIYETNGEILHQSKVLNVHDDCFDESLVSITFDDFTLEVFPKDSDKFISNTSLMIYGVSMLSEDIYSTSPKTCLKIAIEEVEKKANEHTKQLDEIKTAIVVENLSKSILEDELEFLENKPETDEEFAEMALT